MAPGRPPANPLDDVQVLGAWNFTIQGDTPLYWLRTGVLDRYHCKFKVHTPCPSVCGIVMHAEADGPGNDGVSFWIERSKSWVPGQEAVRKYLVSGEGLESRPIITRNYDDAGGEMEEEVEVVMQGYTGAIMVQNRKVTLSFRLKHDRGCLAFYNSTRGEVDDVHFSDVRVTAIRRGPLEISGELGRRFRGLSGAAAAAEEEDAEKTSQPLKKAQGSARGFSGTGFARAPSTALTGRPLGASLRSTASDSVLRKSAHTLCGLPSSARYGATAGTKVKWVATALNPHDSELKLVKDTMGPKKLGPNSCSDFIAM